MKMPVGEKKKRKDKDGEKVSKQNPKNFDHSGIQNLDELLFKSMKPEKSKQRFNILSQTYHALWPYYSVVFNTPKKTVELEVGSSFFPVRARCSICNHFEVLPSLWMRLEM